MRLITKDGPHVSERGRTIELGPCIKHLDSLVQSCARNAGAVGSRRSDIGFLRMCIDRSSIRMQRLIEATTVPAKKKKLPARRCAAQKEKERRRKRWRGSFEGSAGHRELGRHYVRRESISPGSSTSRPGSWIRDPSHCIAPHSRLRNKAIHANQ